MLQLSMSIFDYVVRDNPAGAFKFRFDTNSISSLSGSPDKISSNNTFIRSSALVSGSDGAARFGGANIGNISMNRFYSSLTRIPFTIEAWVKFNTFTDKVSILSHADSNATQVTSAYDGLWSDGNNINFTVKFSLTGSVTCSWSMPDFTDAYHLVGVYTPQGIQLFVNGQMVDSKIISIDQMNDRFASSNNVLYIGVSPNNNQILTVDSVAYYNFALSSSAIMDHFDHGRDMVAYRSNVRSYDGMVWGFTDNEREVAFKKIYPYQYEWQVGYFNNVSISDDVLRPVFLDETSVSGFWRSNIPLDSIGLSVLQGVKAEWNGDGNFVIQTSVDNGTTWTNISNGQIVPGTTDVDSADKDLDVQVIFNGGVADDVSEIRDMSFTVYSSYVVKSALDEQRTILISAAASTSSEDNEPIERNDYSGLSLSGNAYATMLGGTDMWGTVELWTRINSVTLNTEKYILDGNSDTSSNGPRVYINTSGKFAWNNIAFVYINGKQIQSGQLDVAVGEFYHLVCILSDTINSQVLLGVNLSKSRFSDIQVGQFAIYPTILSGDNAVKLYQGYLRIPVVQISDEQVIRVSEVGNYYRLYDYVWSS